MLMHAREQIVDLLGCPGHEIVFGLNKTSLAFVLAASIAQEWRFGDSHAHVAVTEMDHHANIDPWRVVAQERGLGTRWLRVDPAQHCLDLGDLEKVVDENCRLVAMALSSNAVGTISDVARIAARAREVGAISIVDAVHGLSHIPVDLDELGADILLLSAYKMFGPHVGVMAIRRDLLNRMRYYKLAPATSVGYGKAEHGTQNMEGMAGLCATIDLIASLGEPHNSRHRQLTSAISQLAKHEDKLTDMLVDGLASMPKVKLARAPAHVPKTSTVAFTVAGKRPVDIATSCIRDAVYVTNGDFYATTLAERTGVSQQGGWVRVGVAAYHDENDIARALSAIDRAVNA
jgi:cysteine desulfurase family protein (TIGR01976 family)